MMSSFSIWGCVLKGCFERGIFGRAKSRLSLDLSQLQPSVKRHTDNSSRCMCTTRTMFASEPPFLRMCSRIGAGSGI